MIVIINGDRVNTNSESLAEVLSCWGARSPMVVALNNNLVPEHQWSATAINNEDQIEVLSPISGG